jgi:hypothetical protein
MPGIPVYYNFQEFTITIGKGAVTNGEILLTNPTPQANIRVNEINYFAFSIYLHNTNAGSYYLVVKCLADPEEPKAGHIFLAVPMTPGNSSNVDEIIGASGADGGGIAKLTLEAYIKPGSGSKSKDFVSIPQNNGPMTIVAGSSNIPVSATLSTNTYNTVIGGLDITGATSPATLSKTSLDWYMSCDLLDDSGDPYPNPTVKSAAKQKDTANTITLLMMAMMIAGGAYLIAPIAYGAMGIEKIAYFIDGKTPNHYGINICWGFLLILSAIMCIAQGAITKDDIYYFFCIGLVLSYLAATKSVLKIENVANQNGTGFKSTASPLGYFAALGSGSALNKSVFSENPGTPAMIWVLTYAGILIGFILMVVGVAMPEDTKSKVHFSVGISLFLMLPGLAMVMLGYFAKQKSP